MSRDVLIRAEAQVQAGGRIILTSASTSGAETASKANYSELFSLSANKGFVDISPRAVKVNMIPAPFSTSWALKGRAA